MWFIFVFYFGLNFGEVKKLRRSYVVYFCILFWFKLRRSEKTSPKLCGLFLYFIWFKLRRSEKTSAKLCGLFGLNFGEVGPKYNTFNFRS